MMKVDDIERYAQAHGYDFVEMIGRGGFASVALVRSLKYHKHFALKVSKEIATKSDFSEIDILAKLNHPNIIRIYEYFLEEEHLCMILEYCPGGTLAQVLKSEGPIETPKLLTIIESIAQALSFCHFLNIAHRDIKPDNILIDSYGRPILSDFGLAQSFECGVQFKSLAGSRPFMAPEVFSHAPFYNPFTADIWSLGVLMYTMMFGRLPWNNSELQNVKNIIKFGITVYPPHPFLDILKSMLAVNPNDRPSIRCVLEMIKAKKSQYPPHKHNHIKSKHTHRRLVPHSNLRAVSTFSLTCKVSSTWKTKKASGIPFYVQIGTYCGLT